MTPCDPNALLDHLLDARCAMRAAQDLSTEGAPIYKAMANSIVSTDEALRLARAMAAASKAAA